jgi:hypothetical protein
MIETAQSTNYFPVEKRSLHREAASSPWRPPDFEKESRTLVALGSALVESPSNILQKLADTILDVTQYDLPASVC